MEFLFTGLFCPALQSPQLFLPLAERPGRITSVVLELYSKLLYNLASGECFPSSKAALLNDFLREHSGTSISTAFVCFFCR
jgi:hypothetical protein